eukprot:Sspe_Gene.108562::Locus_87704_Transcript_1_1_Confidence_1.000_Length_1027::g.108562::m.108562
MATFWRGLREDEVRCIEEGKPLVPKGAPKHDEITPANLWYSLSGTNSNDPFIHGTTDGNVASFFAAHGSDKSRPTRRVAKITIPKEDLGRYESYDDLMVKIAVKYEGTTSFYNLRNNKEVLYNGPIPSEWVTLYALPDDYPDTTEYRTFRKFKESMRYYDVTPKLLLTSRSLSPAPRHPASMTPRRSPNQEPAMPSYERGWSPPPRRFGYDPDFRGEERSPSYGEDYSRHDYARDDQSGGCGAPSPDKTFYKGGQFLPGGGRAPKGGCWV